jgi:hypothetical protein
MILPTCLQNTRLSVLLLCLILGLSPIQTGLAQQTLKGYVEEEAKPFQDQLEGVVLDAKTLQPLPNADVALPDQGYSMKTGPHGEYRIPRAMGKQALIMSITKEGYAPFSVSISQHAPPLFNIRLQKAQQMLVLDDRLRHLGDGSFSPHSSGASAFRKAADGPAIRIPFSTGGLALSNAPYLQVGSIIGVDTRMAHHLSGNNIGVSATPLLIKLNGTTIAQVQVNGDNQKIQLPRRALNPNGNDTLEIEAGYQITSDGRLDYDDMELMHIVVYP